MRRIFVFNGVMIPVGFGLLGFIIACFLFNGSSRNHIAFQELVIQNKKELSHRVIHHQLEVERDSIKNSKDSLRLLSFHKAFNNSLRDSIVISDGNIDTSLTYLSKYILFHRDSMRTEVTDSNMEKGTSYSRNIPALLIDSNPLLYRSPIVERVSLKVRRDDNKSMVDFFTKNPLFAFWLIFSIAQFTLWFMAIPLLGGLLKTLMGKVTNVNSSLTYGNWLLSSILPAVFLLIFCYLLYYILIDVDFINNQFFWEDFTSRTKWYAVAGYVAAVSCLSMFLLMSLALDQLDKTTSAAGTTLQADPVRMNSFQALKKGFDNSFLASAIILSVFVVWVGLTFQAVNHIEAMRLFSLYAGQPFLNFDFVYIIGGIHTLILFIFYFPVKLKFNSLAISDQATGAVPAKTIWKGLLDTLSSILVTASPLIAGIIQHLITVFTS